MRQGNPPKEHLSLGPIFSGKRGYMFKQKKQGTRWNRKGKELQKRKEKTTQVENQGIPLSPSIRVQIGVLQALSNHYHPALFDRHNVFKLLR